MGNALAIMPSFPERDVFSEMDPPKSLLVNQKGFILCAGKEFDQQEIENFLKIFAQKGCKMIEGDYQRFFDVLYGKTVLQQDVTISSKIDFYQNTPLEYQKFHLKKHTDGFEFGLKINTKEVTLDDVIHFFWRKGIMGNFDLEMLNGIIENPGLKTRSIFITNEGGENKKPIEEQFFDPTFFIEKIRANTLQVITSEVPQKSLRERLIESNNAQNDAEEINNSYDDREQEERELEQLEEQKGILAQKLRKYITNFSSERKPIENFIASFIEVDYSQEELRIPLTNLKNISDSLSLVKAKSDQYTNILINKEIPNREAFEKYAIILKDLEEYVFLNQKIVQIITKKL